MGAKKRVYIVKYPEIHYHNFKVSASSVEEAHSKVGEGKCKDLGAELWNHDDARGVTVTWDSGKEFETIHLTSRFQKAAAHELADLEECSLFNSSKPYGDGYKRAVCTCGWKSIPEKGAVLVAIHSAHAERAIKAART